MAHVAYPSSVCRGPWVSCHHASIVLTGALQPLAEIPPQFDPELYAKLRTLAGRIHAERVGKQDTLQPTGLLHEAWIKLFRSTNQFKDRAHYFSVAARAMRQILADRARARAAQKRGGAVVHLSLTGIGETPDQLIDIIALNDAIDVLESIHPRVADVVVLRTFGGLTLEEAAEALSTSVGTVKREWRFGRAWITVRLEA